MIRVRHGLPIIVAVLAMILAGVAQARPRVIDGRVTYREFIALPPSAVVEVSLVDVSLADAPARIIARTTRPVTRRTPIRYRLHYDDRTMRPTGRYALQARITVGGRLWFVTTTHHAVIPGRPADGTIVVQRVGR